MRLTRYNILSPRWSDPIDPISSFIDHLENRYLSKSKDDGHTKISISITISGPNTHTSISDSYSAELPTDLEKEVNELTEMYVKAMAMVFSKDTSGSTEIKAPSHESGSKSD